MRPSLGEASCPRCGIPVTYDPDSMCELEEDAYNAHMEMTAWEED